jgi:nucleotide-binding universal stress UspA family protein
MHDGTKAMTLYAITNILVPTDFSALSFHAISHAEQIASRADACITLLHVVAPREGGYGTSGMKGVAARLEKSQQITRARKLHTIAQEIASRTRLRVSSAVRIGNIPSTIRQEATRARANLVVMGTHGATGFVETMLGSISYRVAGHCRVPVLSVHKGMTRKGYGNIVYPVRDLEQAMAKFRFALAFAMLYRSRVRIIGLLRAGERDRKEEMRNLCLATKERFAEAGIAATVTFTTTNDFPSATIRHAHRHTDSLVVIAQDRDFLLAEVFRGTFSKAVLHKVLSPVLTIPGRS